MDKLRGVVAKIFLFVLFSLLIVSFAIWGIGDMFRGRTPPPVVAEVGDVEITQEEFRRALRAEFGRYQEMLGRDFDLDTAQAIGLPQQVLNRLITRALYDQESSRLGMTVTEQQIRDEIFSTPAFQDSRGQFDRARYEQVLRMSQMTEGMLVDSLSREIQREQIVQALTRGVSVPSAMAETLFRYHQERRVADYLVIDRARIGEVEEPSDEALRALFEETQDDYLAPEYRSVTFLHLDPSDLHDEVALSEDELRDAYEQRIAEFERPERRTIEQVIFENREEAEAALDMLRAGRSFAAVAEETTGEPPVTMGDVTAEQILPALSEPVFALDVDRISEPLESAFGWHLVRVTNIEPGGLLEFAEVREELREELAHRAAVDAIISLANNLDDLLAAGDTLEEAAAALQLEAIAIPAIDRQGRDAEGERIAGLPDRERFLEVVFSTPVGDESLLLETQDGGYFVVRVEGEDPPAVRSFADVRDQLRERWIDEARSRMAFERADALADRLRAGESLSDVAADAGLQIRTSDPLTRNASRPSPDLARQLFEAREGEVIVADGPQGPLVATLREVVPADPMADPEALEELRQAVRDSVQDDLLTVYSQALEQNYTVRINQRRLEDALLAF